MRKYLFFFASLVIVVSMNSRSFGQDEMEAPTEYFVANQELNEVIANSEKLIDLKKRVRIQSMAASLRWHVDSAAARDFFLRIWATIDKNTDDGSYEEEDARIDLLQFLFPLDREFAGELLRQAASSQSIVAPLSDKISGTNKEARRLAFLSYNLAEDDVSVAAVVLRLGLQESTAPMVANILKRIREKDAKLSNSLAHFALENIENQSPTQGLVGLGTMMIYVFPSVPYATVSMENSTADRELRDRFADVAYIVLKKSLAEDVSRLTDQQGYSTRELGLRVLGQALIAGTLAVLSQKNNQERFPELQSTAILARNKVEPMFRPILDSQIASVRMTVQQAENDDATDAEIISALAQADFNGAQILISKVINEDRKRNWTNTLLASVAKRSLDTGKLSLALDNVKKMTDMNQALGLLSKIAQSAEKKQDTQISLAVLQEMHKIFSQFEKGQKARAQLTVASEIGYFMPIEASGFLSNSVSTINELSEITESNSVLRGDQYWNNPENFIRSRSFTRAFKASAKQSQSETLLLAHKVKNTSLQMIARLASLEPTILAGNKDKNPVPKKERTPVKQ